MTHHFDLTLDSFILNLFPHKKSNIGDIDFESKDLWICDLLNQSVDLANEYLSYQLNKITDRREKLQLLYICRNCFTTALSELRPPDKQCMSCFSNPQKEENPKSKEEIFESALNVYKKRKLLFEQALNRTDRAIELLEDCGRIIGLESKTGICKLSNSQLVLLYYYALKEVGVELRRRTDISQVARVLHLFTGKEITKISNSDFYKKLQKAPNFKKDKGLIVDLKSIIPYFERVGLKGAIKAIEAEIETATKELNSK